MPCVCVLMSAYNGERYIREQIDSLLRQKDVETRIIVRDDGSTDATCRIIEDEYPEISLIKGSNIGCEPSFTELLYNAPEAEYYAFCDQDDVWMERKLCTAVEKLETQAGPAIYGCNLIACDDKLNESMIIHSDKAIQVMRQKEGKDFFFNMHGCVLVWNSALQNKIRKYRPAYIAAHDAWVNYIGNAIGTMIIDETPYIYYRLHGDNTGGLATGKIERLKKGFRRYFGANHPERDKIAQEILEGYKEDIDQSSEGYQELVDLKDYKKSLKNKRQLMKSSAIREAGGLDRMFWKICILANKY